MKRTPDTAENHNVKRLRSVRLSDAPLNSSRIIRACKPVSHMPYCHGDELAATYATARESGYGFFASNVVQFDIMVGLLRGALGADADLVLQVSRDTCAFYGDGDSSAGLCAFGSYVENLVESKNLNVFLNVDHIHLPDQRSSSTMSLHPACPLQ